VTSGFGNLTRVHTHGTHSSHDEGLFEQIQFFYFDNSLHHLLLIKNVFEDAQFRIRENGPQIVVITNTIFEKWGSYLT
jgi:hypothetical protein